MKELDIQTLVGRTQDEAISLVKEAGRRVRIRSVDGVSKPGTMDAPGDRVNLRIVAGKVSEAFIG